VPHTQAKLPDNMVELKVHPDSGLLVDDDFEKGIVEAFLLDQVPAPHLDESLQSETDAPEVKQQKPIQRVF